MFSLMTAENVIRRPVQALIRIALLTVVGLMLSGVGTALAANKTCTGGNMSVGASWGGSVPAAGDVLRINGACVVDNAFANLAYNTLEVSRGATGTVSWPVGGTATLQVLTVITGTFGAGTIDMTNGGTLRITNSGGSNGWTSTNTTLTPGTGTVNWNVTGGSSTLPTVAIASTFNNLTITATGRTASLGRATTVNGDLLIAAGTLSVSASNFALNLKGDFTNNGTGFTRGTGTVTMSGTAAQIISGSTTTTFNNLTITNTSAAVSMSPSTNIVNVAGTLNMNGAATLLTPAAAVVINSATAGTITGTGTVQVTRITAIADYNSQYKFTTDTLTNLTVEYIGTAAQVISALSYSKLTISNVSAAVTAAANFNVSGTLNMNGAATLLTPAAGVVINSAAAAGTITGSGTVQVTRTAATADYSSQYNFTTDTLTNLTVEYNGAAAQTVSAVAYGKLKINNASGVALPGSDVTVSTLLTLTSGAVTTGANTLITSADCPGSVSRTSGRVAGFLRLHIPAGSPSCTFDSGDSTTHRPINLTFTAGTTAGDLTGSVSQSAAEHPNIAGSDLEPTEDVNRFWTLTNSGVGLGAGGYDATFNFVAGDVDVSADTANFEVRRWNSPTWFTTIAGTRTGASTSATGILGFSDFAVGKKRVRSFTVVVNNAPDTCTAASITITAKDKSGSTVNNYTGTINISTAPGDGDWAVATGGGTLNNGTADDGLATYAFVGGDSGVVTLTLSNVNEDKDLTVTVVDNATGATSSNSNVIQYRGNFFQIANDTLQIAGKPQAMTVTLKRGASCSSSAVTSYPSGNHALKAWYTTDTDHPAGATAPSIQTMTSPPLGTTVPASNNLTLSFTSGAASFTLNTTDVGKYVINLRDDSASFSPGTLNGPSPTITTRPFLLAFRGANAATAILHSTTASSTVLAKAGANFTATVVAYLWDSADDANNDGIPDAGADITNNGLAPRFAWPVTVTAGVTLPSPGISGALTRGGSSPITITQATFSGGAATINDLQYSEVGSVTLIATASDYLNTSGATVGGSTNGHSGLDGTGTAGGYVGRFYPDHFALTATGTLTQACGAGGFSYLGQPMRFDGIKFEARNVANAKTNNYNDYGTANTNYARITPANFSAFGFGARDGSTNLSSRINAGGTSSGTWTTGELTLAVTALTIDRVASPDGPFAATAIGIAPTDLDGVTMQTSDFNIDVDAAGGNDHAQIGGGNTHWRFGRLRLQNASGSQLISMPIPMQAQYWSGNGFVTNTLDGCTSIGVSNIAIGNAQNSLTAAMVTPPVVGGAFVAGIGNLRLPKPSSAVRGSVDVSVNLTGGAAGASCTAGMPASTGSGLTWLQGAWCGTTYDKDPTARATFGTYRNTDQFIYQQENY